MKKLLMAAVAISALATTPALAATDAEYEVTGSVAAACSISATGTALDFGALTLANGNFSNTEVPETTDTAAYCNQAATTVEVTHTAMTTTATPPTGFTNTVDFTPEIQTQAVTLTGDKGAGTALGAFTTLTVRAKSATPNGGLKLVAGSYSGAINITISPNS